MLRKFLQPKSNDIIQTHSYNKIIFLFTGILLFCFCAEAGTIGVWKSYTAKKSVRDCVFRDSVLWAVTSGGMFSYNLRSGAYEQFTTSEGLRTIDLSAITLDQSGKVWVGSSNGFLHCYDPASGAWEYIDGISSLRDAPQKQINDLVVKGDTLFILSDVGISIFILSRLEFGDTYRRFGVSPLLTGKTTALEIFQGKLWVGTSAGIASISMTTTNPSEPSLWQTTSMAVSALSIFHDTLFAATSTGIYRLDGSQWRLAANQGQAIVDLSNNFYSGTSLTEGLYFATSTALWKYNEGVAIQISSGIPSAITALSGAGFAGSLSNGVISYDGTQWNSLYPQGPVTNSFVGIAVDENGTLWSGTGATSAIGFMRYNGSTWQTYDINSFPILGYAGSAYQVDVLPGNNKWVSYFGYGVARVNSDDQVVKVLNNSNGLPYTANSSDNHDFVVATGVVADSRNNIWINIRSAKNKDLLSIYNLSTETFGYIGYPAQTMPILTNIIQDRYETKWFTSISDVGTPSPGLVFYDPTKSLPRRLDDTTGWGIIRETDGLTSNEVSAVVEDRDGSLWVGAPSGGISIIIDLQVPYRLLPYHPLSDQKINDILVDPMNQKWVATDNGIFVLSPDGTTIIEHFDVQSTNGKLPDNKISALALNRNDGTMFFAADNGIASLTTSSVEPVSSFRDLKISPNPFLLPASHVLTIDGLVEGSSLKVLAITGDLIRNLPTPGGRIGFWDGRDELGEYVASGIYLITAYSKDGNAVSTGKVAVVRK